MDEKRKLRVIEKTDEADCEQRTNLKTTLLTETPFNASNQEKLDEVLEKQPKPKFAHPNQSNPIYKNLAKFNNAKIGDKWSIEDLLR